MLELKNILYFYKSNEDKVIIDHLSYRFDDGKMYAILGHSGSGKTTLLSLMAGLDVPVEGEVLVDGENIMKRGLVEHRRHNISLVFQNYNLIDYLTPIENVKLGGKGNPEQLLKSMGLTSSESKRNVLQLSGGQQQRVAIARALASEAPILLADEPTGNLDENTANEIVTIFANIAHEANKCIILVTHDREIAHKADEILYLKNGCIVNDTEKLTDERIKEALELEVSNVYASEEFKERLFKKIT